MNEAQYRLYWREWKQVKTWLLQHGRTAAQAEEQRRALTEKALGYPKSMSNWGSWKNAEFDKVLGAFRAVYDGGNLGAQLHAEEQPEVRRHRIAGQVEGLAHKLWPEQSPMDPPDLWRKKLNAVCYKVCKAPCEKLSDVQLGRVLGVLHVQWKRLQARDEERVAAADKNPF
jgi:hypothetical protein